MTLPCGSKDWINSFSLYICKTQCDLIITSKWFPTYIRFETMLLLWVILISFGFIYAHIHLTQIEKRKSVKLYIMSQESSKFTVYVTYWHRFLNQTLDIKLQKKSQYIIPTSILTCYLASSNRILVICNISQQCTWYEMMWNNL